MSRRYYDRNGRYQGRSASSGEQFARLVLLGVAALAGMGIAVWLAVWPLAVLGYGTRGDVAEGAWAAVVAVAAGAWAWRRRRTR